MYVTAMETDGSTYFTAQESEGDTPKPEEAKEEKKPELKDDMETLKPWFTTNLPDSLVALSRFILIITTIF